MEYRKPKQLYFKLFWTYTAIVVIVVGVVAGYFISEMRSNILESRQENAQRSCSEAAQYIDEKSMAADDLYMGIYRDKSLLNDILKFLSLEPEEYRSIDWTSILRPIKYNTAG